MQHTQRFTWFWAFLCARLPKPNKPCVWNLTRGKVKLSVNITAAFIINYIIIPTTFYQPSDQGFVIKPLVSIVHIHVWTLKQTRQTACMQAYTHILSAFSFPSGLRTLSSSFFWTHTVLHIILVKYLSTQTSPHSWKQSKLTCALTLTHTFPLYASICDKIQEKSKTKKTTTKGIVQRKLEKAPFQKGIY